MSRAFLFSIAVTAAVLIPGFSPAQDKVNKKDEAPVPKVPGGGAPTADVARLEARIKALEDRVAREESTLRDNSSDGAVVFLYGASVPCGRRTPAGAPGSGSSWGYCSASSP